MRDFGTFSSKRHVFITPSSEVSDAYEETETERYLRAVVDDSKERAFSRYNKAVICVNSHRDVSSCIGSTQVQLKQNVSMQKRKNVLPLAKKLFTINNCWERQN